MKRIISYALTLLMLTLLMTGCGGKKTAEGSGEPLKMGTNAEFPPFEFINDNGDIDGFDIAIVKEIAKKLDRELVIENMEFKSLIGAMEAKQIDMIAAGMTVDEDRKKSVNFSDPYFTATIQIVVMEDNTDIKSGDDLSGKKVAVQEGTTSDFICTDDLENVEVIRFKKNVDAIMELKAGRCDAVVLDSNPAKEFVSVNPGMVILENDLGTEDYAIALPKDNEDLLKSVNDVLKEIKENGTYDKLVSEYIG